MSWTIRFLDQPPLHQVSGDGRAYDGTVDFAKFAIGDMAFYHYQGKPLVNHERLRVLNLTAHYFTVNANRPPLILALPDYTSPPNGKLYFLVDGQCFSATRTRCGKGVYGGKCECPEPKTPRGYYDGWTVSGRPPLISVSPSVNYDSSDPPIHHYHGFIQNGVIGDG